MEILGIIAGALGGLLGLIIIIGIGIGIFLLLRFFWLWYWKVNDIVDLLRGIDSKLMIVKSKLTDGSVVESNDSTS